MTMACALPGSLPNTHEKFLTTALDALRLDTRIVGVAAGGSFLTDSMDEFSDLDLVVAVEPTDLAAVMEDRRRIACSLGPLLAAFTGEHVGEPRLLICLYDLVPLLHVDLKLVSLADVAKRVEDPAILWEREGRLSRALGEGIAEYPALDLQWIEDRFWIWIHYGATKIGRGELFEALAFLSFLRMTVLGPLALLGAGARPTGVRKLERLAPESLPALEATLAEYDAADCMRALRACADLYRAQRAKASGVEVNRAAERASLEYLETLACQVYPK